MSLDGLYIKSYHIHFFFIPDKKDINTIYPQK